MGFIEPSAQAEVKKLPVQHVGVLEWTQKDSAKQIRLWSRKELEEQFPGIPDDPYIDAKNERIDSAKARCEYVYMDEKGDVWGIFDKNVKGTMRLCYLIAWQKEQ